MYSMFRFTLPVPLSEFQERLLQQLVEKFGDAKEVFEMIADKYNDMSPCDDDLPLADPVTAAYLQKLYDNQ